MKPKTKAAVLYEIGKPLVIEDIGIPKLNAGQVLVEVAYSGVCRSQLNEIHGLKGVDKFLPHTLGHEGSGKILEVGEGVTKVKPGDHVVLSWIKGAGMEVPSTVYESKKGQVSSGALSTFMHKTVTCENRVAPIADAMPLREAALFGCAIPTGAGIILNTAQVQPTASVAVFGVGGIGLSAVSAAHMVSAGLIVAVDLSDEKLKQASRAGATHLVNANQVNSVQKIWEITNGRGVDYAVEAAGNREAMEAAFESVRENGGLCVLAGNLADGQRISLNPFNLIKGKRIVGTWGGETVMDRDIPEYVRLYLSGKLKANDIITHVYPLEKINDAFAALESESVGRALIEME